jgi:hypothetical protein
VAKYKSVKSTKVKHLDKFGIPSNEDYALISEICPDEIQKDDIFVYSVKLCDNLIDRDREFFSHEALVQLQEMFVGATGIHNHDWESGNQHSRLYKTELITESEPVLFVADTVKTATLNPYEYIVGYAYTLNSEKNKPLIQDIRGGILKEVSIGFEDDVRTKLELSDGDATRIDNISDVYEWSFVAVPAQRYAGVTKSLSKEEENVMSFKAAKEKLATLKSVSGVDQNAISTILSAIEEAEKGEVEVVKGLRSQLKSAEQDAEMKGKQVKELEDQLVETTLSHALQDVIGGLSFVNDQACELGKQIAQKEVSIGEDGQAQGVDEARAKLKSEYGFLLAPEAEEKDADEDGEEDDQQEKDEDEEDAETKSVDEDAANVVSMKSAKSIDFTKSKGVSTKSATPSAKPRGRSFK